MVTSAKSRAQASGVATIAGLVGLGMKIVPSPRHGLAS